MTYHPLSGGSSTRCPTTDDVQFDQLAVQGSLKECHMSAVLVALVLSTSSPLTSLNGWCFCVLFGFPLVSVRTFGLLQVTPPHPDKQSSLFCCVSLNPERSHFWHDWMSLAGFCSSSLSLRHFPRNPCFFLWGTVCGCQAAVFSLQIGCYRFTSL